MATLLIKKNSKSILGLLLLLNLTACDYLGITPVGQLQARADADAKAIGSGCRQANRSLEECYQLYPKMSKANIFAGWKEMNDYIESPASTKDTDPKDPKGTKTPPPAAATNNVNPAVANQETPPAATPKSQLPI